MKLQGHDLGDASGARVIVVMGVAGAGKSTVGEALATALGAPFVEGDALHPEANVRKMESGRALDDEDRRPWLARVRAEIERALAADPGAVVACSALKRSYREALARPGEGVAFVHLRADREALLDRIGRRRQEGSHFMPGSLLESQLRTLEPPGPDEAAIEVDVAARETGKIVQEIMGRLGRRPTPGREEGPEDA